MSCGFERFGYIMKKNAKMNKKVLFSIRNTSFRNTIILFAWQHLIASQVTFGGPFITRMLTVVKRGIISALKILRRQIKGKHENKYIVKYFVKKYCF